MKILVGQELIRQTVFTGMHRDRSSGFDGSSRGRQCREEIASGHRPGDRLHPFGDRASRASTAPTQPDPEASRSAVRYGWQAAAAMYASLGNQPPGEGVPGRRFELDELIDRAVASGDEHAIKLTEACLRENAIRPDPAYLAAAWNAVGHLSA